MTEPMTDRHGHDGPSQGHVSKHLENLKLDTENRLSELCDGAAGRTVAGATGRHRLHNPSLGRISLNVLRDVFDYSCFNYKFSGLMLIKSNYLGVKRGNLELISEVLLSSFILNYMLIRVKEGELEQEN